MAFPFLSITACGWWHATFLLAIFYSLLPILSLKRACGLTTHLSPHGQGAEHVVYCLFSTVGCTVHITKSPSQHVSAAAGLHWKRSFCTAFVLLNNVVSAPGGASCIGASFSFTAIACEMPSLEC